MIVAIFRVLPAEILKTKRTVALRMAVLTPAALVVLLTFFAYEAPFSALGNLPQDFWMRFLQRSLGSWCALALPLFITLEAALMAGLEHAENQWKNLFALPVPRWTVYVSKLLVVTGLITISTILLFLFVILGGRLLSLVQPQLPFPVLVPWQTFLRLMAEVAGLSLLAIGIQHWVSVRWRSFPVAVGLGLVVTVTGVVILSATARTGPEWARYFPWTLATVAVLDRPANLTPFWVFNAGAGLLAAVAGCWDFCRRDVR